MDGHSQTLGQDRLPHTRGVLNKEVASGQKGDNGKVDGLGFAFDYPTDIFL